MIHSSFSELGRRLIQKGKATAKLGEALTDGNTPLETLVDLADAAGFSLKMEFIVDQQPQGGEDD